MRTKVRWKVRYSGRHEPTPQLSVRIKPISNPYYDELSYRWFHHGKAGRGLTNKRELWSVDIQGADTENASLIVADKFPQGAKDMHIILEVEDNGEPSLHAYRRIVLQLEN